MQEYQNDRLSAHKSEEKGIFSGIFFWEWLQLDIFNLFINFLENSALNVFEKNWNYIIKKNRFNTSF